MGRDGMGRRVEEVGGKRIDDLTEAKDEDLVRVKGAYGQNFKLDYRAAEALAELQRAAQRAGVITDENILLITSGLRTQAKQDQLFAEAVRNEKAKFPLLEDSVIKQRVKVWTAEISTHRTGRAVDFYLGVPNRQEYAKAGDFDEIPAFIWLKNNAEEYGFYPYTTEPWHWEYNPKR